MGHPKVSAIVLNWQDRAATTACVASLSACEYPDLRVVVVDNGAAEARFAPMAGVDIVRNATNLGFAGGVYVGMRHALDQGADYVWLVNSDAIVPPDVLSQLVTSAEQDPRIGLISPVFHNPDTDPEVYAARFDPPSGTAEQTADPKIARGWQRDCPERIVLLGTALLIKRRLIETIGELDDRFFAYVEDVDYSLRSLDAGFRNVVEPRAVVFHAFRRPIESPSSGPAYLHYFMSRNYLLLWRKRSPLRLTGKPMFWLLRQRLRQARRLGDNPLGVDALLAGLWDGIIGRGGPFPSGRQMPWACRFILCHLAGIPIKRRSPAHYLPPAADPA